MGSGPAGGYGVFGEAPGAGYGVFGFNGATGYGVYGAHNNSVGPGHGYAGYFSGDVTVADGVLTATVIPPSDARLKKDINDSSYGLAQVEKLRPVTYHWKSKDADPALQVGLIAQEVQLVVPEVVHADGSSGMLSVNYNALLPGRQRHQTTAGGDRAPAGADGAPAGADRRAERAAGPSLASVFPGTSATTVGLLLLPLGLLAWRRRRQG